MKKLNITQDTLLNQDRYCWACGSGNKQLGKGVYHSREKCTMPWYNGEPHRCKEGIKLMHRDSDCPYKRFRRIRMEN
jgi:hypothetical protein